MQVNRIHYQPAMRPNFKGFAHFQNLKDGDCVLNTDKIIKIQPAKYSEGSALGAQILLDNNTKVELPSYTSFDDIVETICNADQDDYDDLDFEA